ncbi:MAG: hypothetical protein LUE16_09505 [Lachnospiraceae bacterium]|nr:hypothetical protein [Lachnospiraceae bacterium]
MKRKLALFLAVTLVMGSLSGCSWWSSAEEEDSIPAVEENTISSGGRTNSDEEASGGAAESSEAEETEDEELPEEEIPLDTWEALTLIEENEMVYVEAGEDGREQYIFTSEEDGIELALSSGATGSGAYLTINEEEYLFAGNDSAYYVSALSVPRVVLYDLNGDEAKDIIIWAPYSIAVGTAVEQNIYLSGTKDYTALGSMAWNMDEESHAFDYSIELCDEYLVHLSIPDYKIDSWVELDETFIERAIALGLYDSEGAVTGYGLEWQETVSEESPVYQAPFEESIECGINADGEFVLRAFAPVASGYSGYPLGVTLVEDYKIADGAYELSDVQVAEDQIYEMLTVDGCLFRLQDKVRGRTVQLVQVTEDGEEEIDVQNVDYASTGTLDARTYKLVGVGELMGYPAFYADYGTSYWRMNYYYGVKDGEVIELGTGWGGDPEEVNFLVDVDEDGERELICNVTYGADGAQYAYIYYQEDGLIYQGCFDLPEEVENLISRSVTSRYLPEENMIEVTYLVDEDGQTVRKTVRSSPRRTISGRIW